MSKKLLVVALTASCLAPVAAAAGPQASPEPARLGRSVSRACAVAGPRTFADRGAACRSAGAIERVALTDDVAHYSFDLALGPGEYDRVRLHRVVREHVPWLPVPSQDAAFLLHGARQGFEGTFLTSAEVPGIPTEQALAVFLAEGGVDVWAIDSRWVTVPAGLTDLSFMDDWDLAREVEDLRAALAVARWTRGLTGSGFGRLHLLGYSRGGQVAYSYVNEESQLPAYGLSHVAGLIVGDAFIKSDDEAARLSACASLAGIEAQIAGGASAADLGFFNFLGDLAVTAPDDVSPFIPPLTNGAVVRLFGSDAAPDGVVPFFHQVAGDFVPPADFALLYTDHAQWASAFARGAAFMPLAADRDLLATQCGEEDVPWDDHLADVEVPVLYLGAGGGIGEFGLHSLDLLGSADIEVELIAFEPPELRGRDFGHRDLLLADDAEALVWDAVLAWIGAH